ncbi:MAG TPA: hypothetical protein VFJ06_09800 [Halococcus sp.]|nr:hypothetical protein [Halococcus sp.]
MVNQITAEQPTDEHTEKTAIRERTTGATLWVVLAVALSVPFGGALTGYVLGAGFSVLDPWFLLFALVSFASALLGAAGTALVMSTR